MTSFSETMKYGFMAPWYRAVAESLVFGVQYTIHCSVEGDIAEFGCQSGRTATVIAATMKMSRSTKTLHLFDSFQGMPESVHSADVDNVHVKSGVWAKGELKGLNAEQLRRRCERYLPGDSVRIYEGWFSETLRKIPEPAKFAMLHIDCDLYQSTIDVLDFLFRGRRVSEGAVIFFDDWDCNRASNSHGERKAWREICERYRVNASDAGGYAAACHKFIVHSYQGM
jgi:hypothetical protein